VSESSPLRILLIDDTPGAETYVSRWLQADIPTVDVRRAPSQAALSEALASDRYDVVITEAHLSWTEGLDILRAVKARQPEHPVLMLTSQGDEDLAVSAMQAGFDAYLRKGPDQGGRLAAAVNAALETARERTARRRAEQALIESETRHRAILETATDTIVTIDEHGRIESVNPAVRRMFGYEPFEVVGREISLLMPLALDRPVSADGRDDHGLGDPHVHGPGEGRVHGTGAAHAHGPGEGHVHPIAQVTAGRRKDGSTFPLDLAISDVRLAGRRLFTGIIRDITEHRRAEAERIMLLERERAAVAEWRREATEKSLILENMLDAVIVTDREGRYVLVNGAAGRLLGMDPVELIGIGLREQSWQTFDENGEPLPFSDRPLVRALRGERASIVQRIRTMDGREVVARAASAPVRDESGAIVGAVHVVHDVTEDYARARQVAHGAKLRSLGQLAGGVAHDLNQYLGLVVGYGDLAVEALEAEPADLDSARDSVSTMIRAAVDGAEAVRRLLLFARPSADGPATRVELDEVLREVAKLTAPRWRDAAQQQGRRIAVNLEIDDGEMAIDGWASDLREAFANLVLNAVDALPQGGTIRLGVRRAGHQIVAEVEDDGIGMSAETRERLFEPFFSTKGEAGSGLGLAIVFGIVERHSGQITVESTPGRGTVFALAFPSAARPEQAGGPLSDDDVARELRILVVDDEPALATMLARLLGSDGHDVTVATSGEEALAILASSPTDVVVSDLSMGAGMNGWELAEAVRALPSRPRFILTTGWGAEIEPDDAAARGVMAVVSKPYRLPDLRKILNTI
jgi:PAS domain S-box-containing protein